MKLTTKNCATIYSFSFDEIEKIDFALCKQPTEKPTAYYERQAKKPTLVTNGGFFVMSNGETCFGLTDEGIEIATSDYRGVGVIGNKELHLSDYTNKYRDFISAYPVLIDGGKKVSITYATEINYKARRTAIGWNDTTYFVVTVETPGMKFSTLQDLFIEIGAKYAINLDGGGSTIAILNGQKKTTQIYIRPVDNVMCIYTKKSDIVNFSVPAICTKKTQTRDIYGNLESKRYIDKNDVVQFNKITDNLLVEVEYLTSNGKRIAYLKSIENFKEYENESKMY